MVISKHSIVAKVLLFWSLLASFVFYVRSFGPQRASFRSSCGLTLSSRDGRQNEPRTRLDIQADVPRASVVSLLASSDRQGPDKLEDQALLNEKDDNNVGPLPSSSGVLVLLTVPFAWGTFEPAVRYVYAIDPPIPGFVFGLSFYFVAAATLVTLSILSSLRATSHEQHSVPILGGLELGSYLFLGNALQTIGLQSIQSDRAAFLLQLTTIIVPVLQATIVWDIGSVSLRTWAACFVALLGVGILGLDGSDTVASLAATIDESSLEESFRSLIASFGSLSDFSIGGGDLFVVGAAFLYSMHCIRLEVYAQRTTALVLAASKATTETVLSALTVAGLAAFGTAAQVDPTSTSALNSFLYESGHEIAAFLSNLGTFVSRPPQILAPVLVSILWTGLITCAYTIYAQSYGQRRVRPVTANLIYTIQPLCTAAVAWILLGEKLGLEGYVGGSLIGLAVLLVIL